LASSDAMRQTRSGRGNVLSPLLRQPPARRRLRAGGCPSTGMGHASHVNECPAADPRGAQGLLSRRARRAVGDGSARRSLCGADLPDPTLNGELIAEDMARAEKLACAARFDRCYSFPGRLEEARASCSPNNSSGGPTANPSKATSNPAPSGAAHIGPTRSGWASVKRLKRSSS